MNKYPLVKQLLGILQGELDATLGAVSQAHDNAVHEQSKPENQYDTLALEAAYLAHGQSLRAAELQRKLTVLKHFKFTDYLPDSAVNFGSIIQVQDLLSTHSQWLWVLPVAGGVDLYYQNLSITTITAEAPLGSKVLGCYQGDEITLRLGANEKTFEIMAIR